MQGKRNQGGKRKDGETQNDILLFLMDQPEYIASKSNIKDYLLQKANISETKGITNHLSTLVSSSLIVEDPEYKNGFQKRFAINNNILFPLINRLISFDGDTTNSFLNSVFYQNMVPKIVTCFEESIPYEKPKIICPNAYTDCEAMEWYLSIVFNCSDVMPEHFSFFDMPYGYRDPIPNFERTIEWKVPTEDDMKDNVEYLRDTCNLKLKTTDGALSPEDRMNITESLESSISALKFIMHFFSLDENSRLSLILNIECDLIDPQYAPDAAYMNGYMECIEDIERYATIPEDILKSIFTNLNKKRQDEPVYFWSSFFNMLDKFGAHYPFLFE